MSYPSATTRDGRSFVVRAGAYVRSRGRVMRKLGCSFVPIYRRYYINVLPSLPPSPSLSLSLSRVSFGCPFLFCTKFSIDNAKPHIAMNDHYACSPTTFVLSSSNLPSPNNAQNRKTHFSHDLLCPQKPSVLKRQNWFYLGESRSCALVSLCI